MPKRDGGESRKNNVDGIWLNPKCQYNGQSAAKARIEQSPTTIPFEGSTHKRVEVGRP